MLICIAFSKCTLAYSPDQQERRLINSQLEVLLNVPTESTFTDILLAYENNAFTPNTNNTVSYGFTDDVIWAVYTVSNTTQQAQYKTIEIDNAWLDYIDIYFLEGTNLANQVSLGDTSTFSQRSLQTRMPSASHLFAPGQTHVFFRFQSQDPVTVPIYIGEDTSFDAHQLENAYFYGALYGSLLMLLIYNIVLYCFIKERRHLLYSFYLLAFTAFNFTYTGHGFWLLWSESVFLQQWLMPVLMFCYLFSGVMFTIEFLNTRVYLPSLYASRYKIYIGLGVLVIPILLSGNRSLAIMIQLIILSSMAFWMLLIGGLVWRNKNPIARLFIPAILLGTGGAAVSSLATWGFIPYSQWAFRGIEIGMLLEMSLLSISLGFTIKAVKEAQIHAEANARIDPLTKLYNRRAFTDLVHPIWELGKRNNASMSIMLIDLDWFKQINDDFGHAVGDRVLQRIASELSNRLRVSDIALRWGGEEFLIFLPNTVLLEAKLLADELRNHIDSIEIENHVSITMSIGVASADSANNSIDSLIKKADDALYTAKHEGRNRVVVSNVAHIAT
ncbi:MAG: diguanylate cyclase [Glaciecola sp.]